MVLTEFLSTHYNDPSSAVVVRALDNGRLELLRIEPKQPDRPSFSARWDIKDDSVDIDLHGDAEEVRKFASQKPDIEVIRPRG